MKHLKNLLFISLFLFSTAQINAQCIALSSAPGTDAQKVCVNTAIVNITYLVVPTVTGVAASGLPPGVLGLFTPATFTYTISGTPTTVGAYTYVLTTSGCIGVISGSITVNPDQTITLASSTGTAGQTVCAGTAISNIIYNIGGGGTGATVTGLPDGVTGNYSSGIFTISGTPSISSSGVYNYTVTTSGTCKPATANGSITVNPLPATTASNNGPVCVGSTLSLTGGPTGAAYSYAWTGPNGFSSSQRSPTVSNNATTSMSGTYTLTVTNNTTTCKSSASTDAVVNANPVATASSNSPVCVGSALSLTGGPSGASYSYAWSGPNGFSSTLQNPVVSSSATTAMAGIYSLTVTNSNGGCQGSTTTSVTVNALPAATASNNGPVCAGSTLSLTGGPSGSQYSYSWTGPNSFTSSQMSPVVSTSATLLMAGTYTLRVTNTTTLCQNTATTTVVVNALPVATAGSNSPVCVGNPLILAGGPAGMTTYYWTGPNGYTSNQQNPVVSSSATTAMAGTYNLTVTNSSGCPGSALTSVVVNVVPVATATNNGPVCAGQPLVLTGGPAGMVSYSWTGPNGFVSNLQSPTVSAAATAAMSGVYTLVVTNGTSCTSTATTTATVNISPVAIAANSGPVCVGSALALTGGPAGMTAYSWTGPNSFTSTQMSPQVSASAATLMAGVYTLTVTGPSGCQDTATTRAYVYTVPVSNAGTGGTECDLNFVLNAVPSVGTGLWSVVTGPGTASFAPNANAPNATVTVSAYGTYTFSWTETNGPCTNSSVITVNFYQQPVANAGTGGNECDLNFTFNAVASVGTGTWTMTSGTGTATFSNANSPTATVTVSTYGAKVFTWSEVNGTCTNSASITVNFYQQPVAEAGPGGNICGNEYNLRAVPSAGTGTWTRISGPGNITFSPNANSPTAKATASAYGIYVLRWTEVNGTCSSFENISVTYIQQPSANAGNGGDECDKDFVLNASAGAGTWSLVSGPSGATATFAPNANTANARVTVSLFGSYEFAWTITNSLCTSSDIINVNFHDLPAVDAGNDLIVCKGSGVQLTASGTGNFSWTPVNLLNNANIYNPIATPLITTTFTVTLTDQYGCKKSDQVNVEVRIQPVADAGPDMTLNYRFDTIMNAQSEHPLGTNETGEWTVLSGTGVFSDINDPEATVSDLKLGENSFIWTVTNGACPVASDTVYIVVNDLIIPTLITPNNDSKNEYFVINGIETLGKTSLTIFNRWGTRVFENKAYDNKWNGVNDDEKPLPDDTYFFVLKPEKSKPVTGYIVIRR